MTVAEQIVAALGTKLSYSTDAGSTFVRVGQVYSVKGPGLEMSTVPTFNLASTLKTERPTLPEMPELDFHIQYDPRGTTHIELLTAFEAGTVLPWKVEPQGGGTGLACTFSGFIKGLSPDDLEPESNFEADVTIMCTTLPAWA